MSVPPRGARNRRSGRRPGWQLLTALLVLAILASSTIVFSNKVELLRLAVILSLWAAVLAAFVSVVYRRQSELDQARARDMKYVYDLQLDREIAARREYELGVEAHLRRQLTRELRTEANEEMAALRAELISLRSHLEAMLGTDLSPRPALADPGERPALESDQFAMAPPLGRVESSRVTVIQEEILEVTEEAVTEITVTETVTEETVAEETLAEEVPTAAAETAEPVEIPAETPVPVEAASPIIDVPEEPIAPPAPPVAPPATPPPAPAWQPPEYRGSHRRPQEAPAEPAMAPPPPRPPVPPQQPTAPWRPPETQPRRGRHWSAEDTREPAPAAEPILAAQSDALRGTHRAEDPEPAEQPAEEAAGQHTGGYSVADLMARLQVDAPVSGGGRRRRED